MHTRIPTTQNVYKELKEAHFFSLEKGSCLYMSMLLDLIGKP